MINIVNTKHTQIIPKLIKREVSLNYFIVSIINPHLLRVRVTYQLRTYLSPTNPLHLAPATPPGLLYYCLCS